MGTYYMQPGYQNLIGSPGNDEFIVNFDQVDMDGLPSPEHDIDWGDIVNGGAGYDVLWAGHTMDYGYSEDFDFRPVTFVSIEQLNFNYMIMPMPGDLIFNSSQFGTGLSNNLVVRGAWWDNTITVNLDTTNFDASGWSFPTGDQLTDDTAYCWGPYFYTGPNPSYHNTQVGVTPGGSGDWVYLVGSASNNNIVGSVVADGIAGYGGNDTIRGGLGNDWLDGGDGVDTVDWSDATGAIVFTLSETGGGTTANVAGIGVDYLQSGFENIIGGSGKDVLKGNSFANQLSGGLADDRFLASGGGDTYLGGDGIDEVSYATLGAAVINFITGVHGGSATGDSFGSIELFSGSSSQADTMTAGTNGRRFFGNGGNDTLTGGNGNDTLNGGSGNDTLNGGGYADNLTGGTGNDTMTGGGGRDNFIYKEANFGQDHITDFTDGSYRLWFDSAVADAFSDFTIGNNGTSVVTVTLGTQTITLDSAAGNITLTASDFVFM